MAGEQMGHHLDVDPRVKNGAFFLQTLPERLGVGQRAVVPECQLAPAMPYEQRLQIFTRGLGLPAAQIQRVTDGRVARQPVQDRPAEHVGHEPGAFVNSQPAVLHHCHAGAFLASVLQRQHSVVRQPGGAGVAENAEDAAVLAHAIGHADASFLAAVSAEVDRAKSTRSAPSWMRTSPSTTRPRMRQGTPAAAASSAMVPAACTGASTTMRPWLSLNKAAAGGSARAPSPVSAPTTAWQP